MVEFLDASPFDVVAPDGVEVGLLSPHLLHVLHLLTDDAQTVRQRLHLRLRVFLKLNTAVAVVVSIRVVIRTSQSRRERVREQFSSEST